MQSISETLERACSRAREIDPLMPVGRVRALVGNVVEAEGMTASTGSLCHIETHNAGPLVAEVIGFQGSQTLLMPLAETVGVAAGAFVRPLEARSLRASASDLLGRVVDGLARPIDALPPAPSRTPRRGAKPSTLRRGRVEQVLDVGVRSINALLTIGRGTRMGLFSGPGVGKSTLLGQIARFADVDCFVVGLIGERGREVREFVERELGDSLARAIVVVSTGDEAPVMRKRAAELATSFAEELRDEGRNVLLLVDSLTRVCAAQREIGLAAGEPPATRGYPPSVWSELPRLLERAGTSEGEGSITGIYTVLVEGDDLEEPVADAARSLLDGHIVLSRRLAERGQFPAVDVLASISRTMTQLVAPEQVALATRIRSLLAARADVEDLLSIGAYQAGNDPRADEAVRLSDALDAFLTQGIGEHVALEQSQLELGRVLGEAA